MPTERKTNTRPRKAASKQPNKLMPLRYDSKRVDPWLDALAEKIAADPAYSAVRVTRATVQRMALDEGIVVLAKRYGVELE